MFSLNKVFLITIVLRKPVLLSFLSVIVTSNDDPCGPHQPRKIENLPTGELTSPGYPSSYPNDADCQWHINVDVGFTVQLTFIEFDVEDG